MARDVQPGAVSTGSLTFVPLGGPTVTVAVPSSGIIELVASAHFPATGDDGAVGLFEDGNLVPLDNGNACPGPDETLFNTFSDASGLEASSGTPGTFNFVGCGTIGAPGPIILRRPPGTHTYELRYADCDCAGPGLDATFSDRFLGITPRP
jgi:hypothetical protein